MSKAVQNPGIIRMRKKSGLPFAMHSKFKSYRKNRALFITGLMQYPQKEEDWIKSFKKSLSLLKEITKEFLMGIGYLKRAAFQMPL